MIYAVETWYGDPRTLATFKTEKGRERWVKRNCSLSFDANEDEEGNAGQCMAYFLKKEPDERIALNEH